MLIGHYVAQSTGSSIDLESLRQPPEVKSQLDKLRSQIDLIAANPKLDDDQKSEKIQSLVHSINSQITDSIFEYGKANKNPYALQAASGSRGNKNQLRQLVAGDGLVQDHQDEVIGIPIISGYIQGLDPVEYFAGSFGARAGTISVKKSTAESGFFGKQLAQAAHKLVITEEDCDTSSGIPTNSKDTDSIGSVLSIDTAGFKAGTIITPEVFKRLGDSEIRVRSAMTCQAAEGLCAKCAGTRDKGRLPDIGDNIGMMAAQALGEKISQGSLCLAEGTLVRMADYSTKPIEDVELGDWVLGADKEGETFPVKVVNTYDNGLKDCWDTEFRYLASHNEIISLRSTLDHKVLAMTMKYECTGSRFNNVVRVLPVGEAGAYFRAILPFKGFNDNIQPTLKDDRALLLGLLLGDGCYTKAVNGAHLSCADPKLIADLIAYLEDFNLKLTKLKGHDIYYRFSQIQITLRNPAVAMLNELQINHKYAHEKELPEVVYSWDNQSIASLIGGLIITDGSLYVSKEGRGRINFTSTSKKLVEQLLELLEWRFGIYATKVDEYFGEARKRPLYSFTIGAYYDVIKFLEEIPLLGIKAEKAKELLREHPPLKAKREPRCSRLEQVYLGELPTYDIEVDHPDHLFVLANGLIVSNSAKHTGGQVGAGGPSKAGFDYVDRLIQVPGHFKDAAPLTALDGRVQSIEALPQGGTQVRVAGEDYFIPADQDSIVKVGDILEAGDPLSNGTPNPAEVVKHKGIGEGRKVFLDVLYNGFVNSNAKPNRRNVEVLARGLVNHVQVTSPDGFEGFLPDDVTTFDSIRSRYQPREGFQRLAIDRSQNKYLERPILHYSIGTRITPRVIKDLKKYKVNEIDVHSDPPPFAPMMVRAMENVSKDPNWITRLYGSYNKKSLLDALHRNLSADTHGTSFVPALAEGTDFGKNLEETGRY